MIWLDTPGLEKRVVRAAQLYSRISFAHQVQPLTEDETHFFLDQCWSHRLNVHSEYFPDQEAVAAILRITLACLVLDDLGAEQATPAAIRQFYELVEERRGTNGLYTVITSNLSVDDLEERWRPEGAARGEFHEGMRVTDRLRESWGELEIQGVSLRATHWQE